MRILLTGAEGYIGTLVAPLLMQRGHEVVGLDTGFYRAACLYEAGLTQPPCLDRDTRHVGEADLAGFDAVVHLAELSNDPLGQLNPSLTFQINHRGSVALARAAKQAGVPRFVYASSCSVYGVGSGSDVKTEETEPLPQTVYAQCKILVERDASALADAAFSPTFLRNATAYGASPRMRFDLVLNNLAGFAWTTREIRMVSDGTPWRPLIHVLDIGEAITCVLEAPRKAVHNQVFNVGETSENYQVRHIAEVVAETFPRCRVSYGSSDGDSRSYRVSFDKIHAALPGFRCRHTLRSGAEELREIFERVALTRELFESRAYTRLKQLRYLLGTGQLDAELFWTTTPAALPR